MQRLSQRGLVFRVRGTASLVIAPVTVHVTTEFSVSVSEKQTVNYRINTHPFQFIQDSLRKDVLHVTLLLSKSGCIID